MTPRHEDKILFMRIKFHFGTEDYCTFFAWTFSLFGHLWVTLLGFFFFFVLYGTRFRLWCSFQIAARANCLPTDIKNIIIWGNNSRYSFPDCRYMYLKNGEPLSDELIVWLRSSLPRVRMFILSLHLVILYNSSVITKPWSYYSETESIGWSKLLANCIPTTLLKYPSHSIFQLLSGQLILFSLLHKCSATYITSELFRSRREPNRNNLLVEEKFV